MPGFFSLQPTQQRVGLSSYANTPASLPHSGSAQTFLDPSLSGGETLHSPFEDEATQAAQGMKGSSLLQPSGDQGVDQGSLTQAGNQFQSNVTGTQFRLPRQVTQATQQPSAPYSPEQVQALQTIGSVQQGLETIPAGMVESLKKTMKESGGQYDSMSDSQLNSFIESLSGDALRTHGLLEGNQNYFGSLNPSQTEGFNLGVDTNLDSSFLDNYTTGTKTGGEPTALDKFGIGDIQGVLGIGSAAIQGDPVKILASLNSVAPNVAKYITDNKDLIGQVGNVAQSLGGAYSLYQGIQGGNAQQIASGIGQLLTGAGHEIGINTLAQIAGVSPGAISSAFGAIGGVAGALGLVNAIERGDPVQAILSAASVYSALSTVAPTVFAPLTSLAASALIAVAPSVAASLGVTVGAGGAMIGGVAAGAALAGPAVAVAAVVIFALSAVETTDAQHWIGSWANVGGEVTRAKEAAVTNIAKGNEIFGALRQANVNDPQILTQALGAGANALFSYYGAGKQPGMPPITVGKYYEHMGEDMTPLNNQTNQLLQDVTGTVMKLHAMGVSPQQLAQIPVNKGWSDIGFYGDTSYQDPAYAAYPQFRDALFSRELNPDTITGGPFMTMLAHISPSTYLAIGGNTTVPQRANAPQIAAQAQADPYFAQVIQANPYISAEQAAIIAGQRQQDFTSGGGGG